MADADLTLEVRRVMLPAPMVDVVLNTGEVFFYWYRAGIEMSLPSFPNILSWNQLGTLPPL